MQASEDLQALADALTKVRLQPRSHRAMVLKACLQWPTGRRKELGQCGQSLGIAIIC